jgi:hypothetical protein
LLSLAMSSIYHVILYLYPLPDFDWKILPNTSKCVNPRTRFVFDFFNFWEPGFYFQTPGSVFFYENLSYELWKPTWYSSTWRRFFFSSFFFERFLISAQHLLVIFLRLIQESSH